ncbi:MAG: SpoIIIAC/SpoIIIAD family protein [Acutalibacteraceae bacterium]
MTVWTVLGVTVAAAFLAMLLRQKNPEQASAVTLIGGAVMFAAAIGVGVPAFSRIGELLQAVSIGKSYSGVLLKALGICLLTQTASDVCRDAGETALAGKAELAGKVLLLLCGLPLFEYAAQMLSTMIGGQAVGG